MRFRGESRRDAYDVIVVGSGIGGLTAAALLARAGRSVLVVETARSGGRLRPRVPPRPLPVRLRRASGRRLRARRLRGRRPDPLAAHDPGRPRSLRFRADRSLLRGGLSRFGRASAVLDRGIRPGPHRGGSHGGQGAPSIPPGVPRHPRGDAARFAAAQPVWRGHGCAALPDPAALSPRHPGPGARCPARVARAEGAGGNALALPRPAALARLVPLLRQHADELPDGRRLLLPRELPALRRRAGGRDHPATEARSCSRAPCAGFASRAGAPAAWCSSTASASMPPSCSPTPMPARPIEELVGPESFPTRYVASLRRMKPSLSSFIVHAAASLPLSRARHLSRDLPVFLVRPRPGLPQQPRGRSDLAVRDGADPRRSRAWLRRVSTC